LYENNSFQNDWRPTPVTGGRGVSSRLLRWPHKPPPANLNDPLDRQIAQLLALHDDSSRRFHDTDLSRMDRAAKAGILKAMNQALDIKA
jgi:hypothetical protein